MSLIKKQIYDNILSATDAILQEKSDVLVHAGDLFDIVKPKTLRTTPTSISLQRLCNDYRDGVLCGKKNTDSTNPTFQM
ncbi:MAG: hypothetical protein WC379_17930 [Methanoregula sp.]|jgi:DNA repair exonuclease SbcCD nuclease subunit